MKINEIRTQELKEKEQLNEVAFFLIPIIMKLLMSQGVRMAAQYIIKKMATTTVPLSTKDMKDTKIRYGNAMRMLFYNTMLYRSYFKINSVSFYIASKKLIIIYNNK